MHRTNSGILLSLGLTATLATAGGAQGIHPIPAKERAASGTPDPLAVGTRSNRFGVDLYRAIRAGRGNRFFAPYSISMALAMARAGARGETAKEMDRVLHSAGLSPRHWARLVQSLRPGTVHDEQRGKVPTFTLRSACALWGQQGLAFERAFLDAMANGFRAPLQRIDFKDTAAARARINAWVSENTGNRIRNIIPEGLPTPRTRLVLGNAIHFKAGFTKPFDPRATRALPFTTGTGKKVEVSMMRQSDRFAYAEDDRVQVIELPFTGEETSMVILLPKRTDGLAAMEERLTAKRLDALYARLETRQVNLRMPRFEFAQPLQLATALEAMGMRRAFRDAADFSGMTRAVRLKIDNVLHKAFIKVDEEGAEAAAATVVMMGITSEEPQTEPVDFVADRPFLFAIRHRKSKCLLFLGRLEDPTAR